jgi:hypothetical protein
MKAKTNATAAQQVIALFATNTFSMDELREVQDAFRGAWNRTQRVATREFEVGDKVKWTGRRGNHETGTVLRVNQKSLTVRAADGVQWKVSASLCTAL